MDDFNASGGTVGSWWDSLTKITGQYFSAQAATSPNAIRWSPYGAGDAVQYGVGANGEIITRGLPAASAGALGQLQSMLPLILAGAAVYLLIRALK